MSNNSRLRFSFKKRFQALNKEDAALEEMAKAISDSDLGIAVKAMVALSKQSKEGTLPHVTSSAFYGLFPGHSVADNDVYFPIQAINKLLEPLNPKEKGKFIDILKGKERNIHSYKGSPLVYGTMDKLGGLIDALAKLDQKKIMDVSVSSKDEGLQNSYSAQRVAFLALSKTARILKEAMAKNPEILEAYEDFVTRAQKYHEDYMAYETALKGSGLTEVDQGASDYRAARQEVNRLLENLGVTQKKGGKSPG